MPAPNASQNIIEIPLNIAGGNKFGRYPKISIEQTFNMIVSDGFLVPYAGYKNVLNLGSSVGRAIYTSTRANIMVVVIGYQVFSISPGISPTFLGNLAGAVGDVYIAENNNSQIAITDLINIYVYNWSIGGPAGFAIATQSANVPNPGYISFQNGRLIVADVDSTNWYLSALNDANTWPTTSNSVGTLQSKPDQVQAAVPMPGAGNNMLLFGHNVVEQWQDVGAALFPYQRSSTFNVDFGCLNASSIASLDRYVIWLASNEQSGATVMVCTGNKTESISTDGIDFKLAELTNPTNCTGFLYRQDGHLLYQFTFPDDNLSYIFDVETKLFFTVTDQSLDYHTARNVVFFNDQNYFVSLKGPNLYQFGSQFTNYQYEPDDIQEIPRIRICAPIRFPDQRYRIFKSLGFTIENGRPNEQTVHNYYTNSGGTNICTESGTEICTEDGTNLGTEDDTLTLSNTITLSSERVDLSISRDGGESFGSSLGLNMNPVGKRKSRFIYQRLGQANDFTAQLQFHGFGRFVCTDGIVEVYE